MSSMRLSDNKIEFVRLSEIDPRLIVAHMNHQKVREHMPLVTDLWSIETARQFVAAKEACWKKDGLGHWAFVSDGAYIGWGGYQLEDFGWDFGLVLAPDFFGLGPAISRKLIAFAKADARLESIYFLLPPSRKKIGALKRMGAQPDGQLTHGDADFLKFRLDTAGGHDAN